MTYDQIAKLIINKLEPLYGDREARAIQRFIFSVLLNINGAQLILKSREEVAQETEDLLMSLLPALLDNTPVQYVLEKAFFCDMEFKVSPAVLIPRQETEEMVMMILEEARPNIKHHILDIGTGSGVIAVSLAKLIPYSEVSALDISESALQIAELNARKHKVKVSFKQKDILHFTDAHHDKYNIIVSNPPYVKDSEAALMQVNVLKHEPSLALFVPDDNALIFYKAIIDFSVQSLLPKGVLWFEINETEGNNIKDLLLNAGFTDVSIILDFHSRERFIKAIWR